MAAAFVALNVMAATLPADAQAEPLLGASPKTKVIENTSHISWKNPLLPYGVIGGLGGAFLLVGGYAQRRRMKIAIPYILACGTAVTILLNPEIVTEKHERMPTEVIVAVDKSASQGAVKGRTEITAAMQAELTRALEEFGNLNIRIVEISSASGINGTEMFRAFNGLADLDPRNVGAVFALTDGQITDVPGSFAYPHGTPLHTILSGQPGETDRVLKIETAPRYGLVGEEAVIRVIAEDEGIGTAPGKKITLRIKGESDEVQTIESATGQSTEVKLKLSHVGPNVISVEVEGLAGEVSAVNNRIVTSVQGIQKAVNVLLISGTVNASAMPLRDIFKSDPDANLVHGMAMRLPEDFDDTPASELALIPFPLKLVGASLPKFDLVVFDHYPNLNVIPLRYLEGIVQRVKDGGAVLVLAGSDFAGNRSLIKTPIGQILPVSPTGTILSEEAAPRAGVLGQRHPVLRGLAGVNTLAGQEPSWGPWIDAVEATQKGGTAILETPDGKPLLVLNRVGKGRTAVLLSDGFSLWKAGYKGGGPYTDLVRRLSHWLMKNPGLEEEALRLTASEDGSKIFIERRTMAETVEPVVMITPSGEEVSVALTQREPGLWRAEFKAGLSGIYQARQTGTAEGAASFSAFTHVGPANARELEHIVSTDRHLKPLSDRTGGSVLLMQDYKGEKLKPKLAFAKPDEAQAKDGTLTIRPNTASVFKGSESNPLIPGWLGALLIAGLAAAGWMREGDPRRVQALIKGLGKTEAGNGPAGPEAGV